MWYNLYTQLQVLLKMWVYCKSCYRTYDGFAQCCFEMDHVIVNETEDSVDKKTI